MRCTPELGSCVRDQVLESKGKALRDIVARAVARGELPPAADAALAHEVASALWIKRALVVGGQVDDAFIAHVTDDVLIPLLSCGSRPSTHQETS
jgi:hypothetical protein